MVSHPGVCVCACARVRTRALIFGGPSGGKEGERERKKKSRRHVQRPLLFTLPPFSVLSRGTGLSVTTWDKPKEAFHAHSHWTRAWSEPSEVTTPLPVHTC